MSGDFRYDTKLFITSVAFNLRNQVLITVDVGHLGNNDV